MNIGRSRLTPGVVAGAAVTVLALTAVPQASAAGSIKGYSEDPTTFGTLASCQNVFTGPMTARNSSGVIAADIDQVTFNFCQGGGRVTPNSLPWSFNFAEGSNYTLNDFDVTITTGSGACRYSGTVQGFMQFPGVYSLSGSLSRQSTGCGGPAQINVGNNTEVMSTSG